MRPCGWPCSPTWGRACWLFSTACACCANEANDGSRQFLMGAQRWAYLISCYVVTTEATAMADIMATTGITARATAMAGGATATHRRTAAMSQRLIPRAAPRSVLRRQSAAPTARRQTGVAHASANSVELRCSLKSARTVTRPCRVAASFAASAAKPAERGKSGF